MFERDTEYLKKEEERYKRLGLKIEDKNILLKNRYKNLKSLFVISIGVSIFYAFIIGFVLGGG